jgi:two-component system, NarL family, nitrate/nitrite response regulator NarL
MPSLVCVVVHPNRIVREGLASILAKSPFEPACTASSVEGVPGPISGGGEQVLVLIGVREGGDLAEAVGSAKASFPDAHVVVVGDATKCDDVTTALRLGAASFVDENMPTSTLVKELELLVLGEPVISVVILKQLLGLCSTPLCSEDEVTSAEEMAQLPDNQEEADQNRHLSGREAAILNGLVQGASNKVIAYQLKITEATVKVHVKSILRKIRVKNRTQAAIWALHHNAPAKSLAVADEASSLIPPRLSYESTDTPMIRSRAPEGSREGIARQ